MRKTAIFLSLLSLALLAQSAPLALASDSKQPRLDRRKAAPHIRPMDCKNLPEFANYAKQDTAALGSTTGSAAGSAAGLSAGPGQGTALRTGVESATLPVQTRMKLVVEYPVSATSSKPGDIFEGHVRDDMFFGRTLILPRGSLVRGRVSEVNKPRLLSRAGKIGLKLDQIVTPSGEVIPLDASLEFQKGLTNKSGQLDPGTNFGTRVESSVRAVSGMDQTGAARGAIVAANVATLGAPIVATAIGSSAVALFRSGDNISLTPGQELEILLTNDLGVQIN